MELVEFERQISKRSVGDFDPGGVIVVIEHGMDAKALVGGATLQSVGSMKWSTRTGSGIT